LRLIKLVRSYNKKSQFLGCPLFSEAFKSGHVSDKRNKARQVPETSHTLTTDNHRLVALAYVLIQISRDDDADKLQTKQLHRKTKLAL